MLEQSDVLVTGFPAESNKSLSRRNDEAAQNPRKIKEADGYCEENLCCRMHLQRSEMDGLTEICKQG